MSDSHDTSTQNGSTEDPPQPPGTPRWVRITLIVVAVFVLALVVKLVVDGGGSGHGPSRHGATGAPLLPAMAAGISSAPPAADL